MAELTLKKKGTNWSIWTDGKQELMKIEDTRCSFPNVGTIQEQTDENTGKKSKSWNIACMLDKKKHAEAAKEFIGMLKRLETKNEVSIKTENKCMKNGDAEGQERKEYEGHYVISVKNHEKKRPAVRDKKGNLLHDESKIDAMFYGGCHVSIMLRPWYFNGKSKGDPKTYPKRLLCSMVTVAFHSDDEPFGEGAVDDSNAWGSGDDGDDGLGGNDTSMDDDNDGL